MDNPTPTVRMIRGEPEKKSLSRFLCERCPVALLMPQTFSEKRRVFLLTLTLHEGVSSLYRFF